MSAAAVDAVRPGLRTALALAISPATPPARRAGRPTTRASGLTSRGASSAMPANRPSTPPPTRRPTAAPLTPLAKIPNEIAASEAIVTPMPALAECAGEPGLRQGRALADSRDRRDPRGASGRDDAGEQRDSGAEQERDDDRVRRDHRRCLRQLDAGRAEQGDEALRDPDPEHESDHGRDEPDHEALDLHGPHDLLARGAERAQRGVLTRPLGDRDRQGVEDHERAHEQGDEAEREQEQLDRAQTLVEVVGVLVRLRLGVLDLERRAQEAA